VGKKKHGGKNQLSKISVCCRRWELKKGFGGNWKHW